MASALAVRAAVGLVVGRRWVWAGIAAGFAISEFLVGAAGRRRTSSEKMGALQSKNQRWLDEWAKGMARSTGSWTPASDARLREPGTTTTPRPDGIYDGNELLRPGCVEQRLL